MNKKGFVSTIIVFTIFVFGILLISYIVYGINSQTEVSNYIIKNVNENVNEQSNFKSVVKNLK